MEDRILYWDHAKSNEGNIPVCGMRRILRVLQVTAILSTSVYLRSSSSDFHYDQAMCSSARRQGGAMWLFIGHKDQPASSAPSGVLGLFSRLPFPYGAHQVTFMMIRRYAIQVDDKAAPYDCYWPQRQGCQLSTLCRTRAVQPQWVN